MSKKLILIISIILCISITWIVFFTNLGSKALTSYIFENMNESDIDFANIYIPNTNVEILKIEDEAFIKDFCDILEEIEVKKQIFNTKTYHPTFGDYYIIQLFSENNLNFTFMIMDKNHIVMYNRGYIITSNVDLEKIYKLLVEYGYLRENYRI